MRWTLRMKQGGNRLRQQASGAMLEIQGKIGELSQEESMSPSLGSRDNSNWKSERTSQAQISMSVWD